MTNLCDVCGKPATQSMLRDLFGKSDERRFVCSDHGFRIRDPADVAAIERLQKREDQLIEFLRSFISGGVNQDFKPWARELYQKLYSSDEPLPQHPSALADHINAMCGWAETLAKAHGWRRENAGSFWSSYDAARAVAKLQLGASRDADHCDYPDCEQHWTNVVAQARALLEPLAEHDPAIRQWLKTPDLPKLRASPADLVGALQDVVHTDPGPVRAGKAHRDAPGGCTCMGCPVHGIPKYMDGGPLCTKCNHSVVCHSEAICQHYGCDCTEHTQRTGE